MFDWNQFFTAFNVNMQKERKCNVGRYIDEKPPSFPYVDMYLADNYGGRYDNEGNEASQSPMIQITVYDTGDLADNNCYQISEAAKKIMLSYGFQCKTGPIPVINASDNSIKRWVSRYQRVYASDEKIMQLH